MKGFVLSGQERGGWVGRCSRSSCVGFLFYVFLQAGVEAEHNRSDCRFKPTLSEHNLYIDYLTLMMVSPLHSARYYI